MFGEILSNEPRFLSQHLDGRVGIWYKQHEIMDPSSFALKVQADGVLIMCRKYFRGTL